MKSTDLITLDEEDVAVARTISMVIHRSAVSGSEVFQDPDGCWMIIPRKNGGASCLFSTLIYIPEEKPFTEHMMRKYPEAFL